MEGGKILEARRRIILAPYVFCVQFICNKTLLERLLGRRSIRRILAYTFGQSLITGERKMTC